MPLSISTNIASLTAQRSFINSNSALETAYERLATGKRINGAGDDAAGLAIGTDLDRHNRRRIRSLREILIGELGLIKRRIYCQR